MAKFNQNNQSTIKTISHEGGSVYIKSPAEEWLNFLFSSYLEDAFYETATTQRDRFIKLTEEVANKYGYEFVAKCAVFARNELGMRSVSQLVAAWLNNKSFENKRRFYAKYPHRPDDVGEVFAAIELLNQKYSHALNRGFADYLSKLSGYALGKYQMKGKEWNMHDIINRTHAYSEHIDAYQKGNLEVVDTWETAISGAESSVEREEEWKRLVETKKLGYLALLRNLRNIYNCSFVTNNWILDYLEPQLTNKHSIEESMVFPYQIYSAARNCGIANLGIRLALNVAFKKSVSNMPTIDGSAVIILDVSGSMSSPISANSKISIVEAGAVYAAALMYANPNIDFIKFGNSAKMCHFNQNDDVFHTINKMIQNDNCGYGTDIVPAFQLLQKHYDKIFLISDMQIMTHEDWGLGFSRKQFLSPMEVYNKYIQTYGSSELFSFDLGNYHTQVVPPSNPNVHLLTSLSEKTFKMINLLSQGENIVDYINNVYDY